MSERRGYLLGLMALLFLLGCKERPPQPAAQSAGTHYGALMSEVGRRFELLGRAAVARRWDLAAFELAEMEETLEELPRAKQPEKTGGANLRGLEQALTSTSLPELKSALKAREPARFASAFGHAAAMCNGCHQASEHAFIEIPSQPGAGVPKLDPLP
jgi:hypothetical protein